MLPAVRRAGGVRAPRGASRIAVNLNYPGALRVPVDRGYTGVTRSGSLWLGPEPQWRSHG